MSIKFTIVILFLIIISILSWEPDGFSNPIGMEQRYQHEQFMAEQDRRRKIEEAQKRRQEQYEQQQRDQAIRDQQIRQKIYEENLQNELLRNRLYQEQQLRFKR